MSFFTLQLTLAAMCFLVMRQAAAADDLDCVKILLRVLEERAGAPASCSNYVNECNRAEKVGAAPTTFCAGGPVDAVISQGKPSKTGAEELLSMVVKKECMQQKDARLQMRLEKLGATIDNYCTESNAYKIIKAVAKASEGGKDVALKNPVAAACARAELVKAVFKDAVSAPTKTSGDDNSLKLTFEDGKKATVVTCTKPTECRKEVKVDTIAGAVLAIDPLQKKEALEKYITALLKHATIHGKEFTPKALATALDEVTGVTYENK